ncbi:uncharacterized protein LOC124146507 isoform X1 [Haliotis rufescens]|uniref:uncharacterized protein LOC124146507 isoform X1 n=1 Tax=Haliotis rufescens TaxID=6454 RepID=UPI00201FA038|nr:uncharacterized protein LOC124146507 isoform X1 [Haliotis rufescens]
MVSQGRSQMGRTQGVDWPASSGEGPMQVVHYHKTCVKRPVSGDLQAFIQLYILRSATYLPALPSCHHRMVGHVSSALMARSQQRPRHRDHAKNKYNRRIANISQGTAGRPGCCLHPKPADYTYKVHLNHRRMEEEHTAIIKALQQKGGCPLTYIQYRMLNICYQIHLNGTTFQSGVADCNSRGEHFIVIDNAEKQNHIRKQINSSSDNISRKFHLDGSDEVNEGRWLLHDDRVMTYFAWGPGYPQNFSGKNFLVADPEVDFLWSDKEGSEEKRYICERDI